MAKTDSTTDADDGATLDAAREPSDSATRSISEGTAAGLADVQDGGGAFPHWDNGAEYCAGEVMVQLPAGMSAAELSERLAGLDAIATSSLSDDDVALGWAKLELASGVAVSDAIGQLEESGAVESAQPNFVYHLLEGEVTGSVNAAGADSANADPASAGVGSDAAGAGNPIASFSSSKALSTIGLQSVTNYDSASGMLERIGAYTAWDTQKTSKAVTVAVIDSGCDTGHEDLKSNIRDTYNVLNGSKNVSDSNGHGTHVAGIIAADADNDIGMSGVSYNAGLIPVKIMEDDTTDTDCIVKAYRYIINNAKRYNVRVVNASIGAEVASLGTSDYATLRVIDQAHQAGILSVFAAGNKDVRVPYYCFPCDFVENGVGVINASKSGMPDSSSNYNKSREKTKDLSAPGCEIWSAAPGNDYEVMTGTSMAAPVVSGVAALVFAKNPKLDAGQAKSVLCSAAEDVVATSGSKKATAGFDQYTGYGIVRADKAVEYADSGYIAGRDSLRKGSTVKLSVPRSGTWKWSSDSPSIAKVNASTGVVTGVGHGEAVISATNGSTTLRRTVIVYETTFKGASSVVVGKRVLELAWANPVAAWTYSSSNKKVATVGSTSGIVKGKKIGTVVITAKLTACPSITISKRVKVGKKNPLSVKAKSKKIRYSQVKSRARTISCCFTFKKKGKGKITYAKVTKGSSKRLSVNKKTGKITVKKGTRRGTYKIKVKVTAAGNATYVPVTKTVTVKVTVK